MILYQIKSDGKHKERLIIVNDQGEEWRYYEKRIVKYDVKYKTHRFCIKAIQHNLLTREIPG